MLTTAVNRRALKVYNLKQAAPVWKIYSNGAYLVLLLCLLTAGAFTNVSAADPAAENAKPQTDLTAHLPPSCLVDFRPTLDAKAGMHGFMTVGKDGHFHWADGKRARFWGINVSSTRLNISNEQIERVVTNFAQAGLNLVRLEAIDNRNCLLGSVDSRDSRHFDPKYLDRLDRWMDALRRHGIYYYLDLLDFRTFKAADGVINADKMDRGARPYALFDRYLIVLQKEYATRLLQHKNLYSGLRTVDDPALAMVEICNEHGFFLYPDKLETLAEPYRTDLRGRWNNWLHERYGDRDRLIAAWATYSPSPALRGGEDPNQQTVDLPMLTRDPALIAAAPDSAMRRTPMRIRDGVAFLASLQRSYFREMRNYLRTLGLHVPVTAVVSNDIAPDVASVAQECDFTAENWYGDGSNEDARTPGMRYYSNRNAIRDGSPGGFAPYTAALRWNNKPVVVREWATTWPNRLRAVSVPEALAYASLQDYDAVLLFGYQTNRAPNGADADSLNDYAFQCDPTTWGLYALAGHAFLSGAVRPALHTATLSYPPWRQFGWPGGATDLHRAAMCVRINSILTNGAEMTDSVPTNSGSDLQSLRALFNRLGRRGAPLSAATISSGVWRSDTEQITRYEKEGRLEIRTPNLCVESGEFVPGRVYSAGRLRFTTQSNFGTIFAIALDGLPLDKSRHLVVKMVTRAENTGELLEKSAAGAVGPWTLRSAGTAPVVTCGRACAQPTQVWIVAPEDAGRSRKAYDKQGRNRGNNAGKARIARGKRRQMPASSRIVVSSRGGIDRSLKTPFAPRALLSIQLIDGTWEMEIKGNDATLTCDTPGISGLAQGRSFTTGLQSMSMTDFAQPEREQ